MLEEDVCVSIYNYTTPSTLDLAEGRCIGTALQFRQELRISVATNQESLGAKKLKKQRSNQLN